MTWEQWRENNRLNWEDRVPIHVASTSYGVDEYVTDPKRLSDSVTLDAPHLGDLEGLDVLHLQCHIGTDTLSLKRLGANSVTGVDFSPSALQQARALFAATNTEGTFVETDVMVADRVLAQAASFDLVYASVGAINWIPDIRTWIQVAANLLKPGGRFYLRDVHPMGMTIDIHATIDNLRVIFPYRETVEPVSLDDPHTYAGEGELKHGLTHEWSHSLAEIFTGCLAAGLEITAFDEHYYTQWQAYPFMVETSPGIFQLPEGRDRLPLMFTLQARDRRR